MYPLACLPNARGRIRRKLAFSLTKFSGCLRRKGGPAADNHGGHLPQKVRLMAITTISSTSGQPRPASSGAWRVRHLVGPSTGGQVLAERRPTSKKMLVDALKLRSEALSRVSPTARGVNGAIKLVTGVQKANAGDRFHAASSAASAMEKLTPVLSRSAVGAATSAAVLAYGDDEWREQTAAIKAGWQQATDHSLDRTKRAHGWLDAAMGTGQLAVVGRAVGKALGTTGRYALGALKQVPTLLPMVGKLEEAVAKVGATQFGKSLSFLNRWIPLLNVAWVVMAGKTALDVHQDPNASTRSKTLSLVALGASAAVFGAGVLLGPWAFAGITVASIGADLALVYSRKQDEATTKA